MGHSSLDPAFHELPLELGSRPGRQTSAQSPAGLGHTLLAWLERRGGTLNDYVFPSRNDYMDHMSTRQCARLVREWVRGSGLQAEDYGTHSLRRTKASIIYKATGNLCAVQICLDTPRSKAQFATSQSLSKTPSNYPSERKSIRVRPITDV
jgi:site-specific recombinase XerC